MAAVRWTITFLCLFGTVWMSPLPAAEGDDLDKELTEYVRGALMDFRAQMPHGLPDLEIPPLDPFTVSNQHLVMNLAMADIDLKLPHAKIIGLSSFSMDRFHVDSKNLLVDFHLKFEEIQATGHYDLNGLMAKLLPVYGNGSFVVHSYHPNFAVVLQLDVGSDEIDLRVRSLDIDWSALHLDLKNFIGDGEISQMLQKLIPVLGKRLLATFNPQVVKVLEKALNSFLAQQVHKPFVQEMLQKILQQSNNG